MAPHEKAEELVKDILIITCGNFYRPGEKKFLEAVKLSLYFVNTHMADATDKSWWLQVWEILNNKKQDIESNEKE